jgi:16S rRNA (adenine1518-N6/adenine1519-N6)-dimethyltransferase
MAAAPGGREYGRLSVMLQYRFRVQKLFRVAAGSFRPVPEVESAVVRLTPNDSAAHRARSEARFEQLVREAFSHRRKTLRNALRDQVGAHAFAAAGIDPQRRPETLSVEDFVRLADCAGEPETAD